MQASHFFDVSRNDTLSCVFYFFGNVVNMWPDAHQRVIGILILVACHFDSNNWTDWTNWKGLPFISLKTQLKLTRALQLLVYFGVRHPQLECCSGSNSQHQLLLAHLSTCAMRVARGAMHVSTIQTSIIMMQHLWFLLFLELMQCGISRQLVHLCMCGPLSLNAANRTFSFCVPANAN